MNQTNPDSDLALPNLQEGLLDKNTLEQLFRDIAQCGENLEVIPKFGPQQYVMGKTISLEQARELLSAGQVRAVQLRYRFESSDWWDTLMVTPQGIRLVRIQHNFGE